jgi:ATP-binding cassette subfamily B protein
MAIENKKASIKSLHQIFVYLGKYRVGLFAVLLSLTMTSGAVLALGKGIHYLVDYGLSDSHGILLNKSIGILALIILTFSIASYFRSSLINIIAEKVVADLRRDVYKHMVQVAPSFFETNKVSEVISTITTDTSILNDIIGSVFSYSLRNIFMMLGGIVLLFLTNWKLTLYMFLTIPVSVVPIIFITKKLRQMSRDSRNNLASLNGLIEDSLTNIKTIQSYNLEEFETNRFNIKLMETLKGAITRNRWRSSLIGLMVMIAFSAVLMILWLGGREVIHGHMTAGALSSFLFYSITVASSLAGITEVVSDAQRAAGVAERLFELMNIKLEIIDDTQTMPIPKNYQNITFSNVSFIYPARPTIKALDNVSFGIKKGEKVAIVGQSGAGKSTICQLLLRLYNYQSGTISIDNTAINKVALNELRNFFAIVSQDPVIFSTNIFDNIRYGKLNASEDEITDAAKASEILDFVNTLPDKFYTYIGERGMTLSGGQKQRIAIARAILRNPEVLILDESTSNLDAENELLVQKALDRLMQNRTTIIISHNIQNTINADKIIVLEEGKVAAIGNHNELLKNCVTYQKLCS